MSRPEGNEKLVAFPLCGLVGLKPCLPSLDVELKESEPVELLPRSLAGGHRDGFWTIILVQRRLNFVFRVWREVSQHLE